MIFGRFFGGKGIRAKGRGPHPEGDKSGRGPAGPARALLDGVLGSFGPSEFTSTGGKGGGPGPPRQTLGSAAEAAGHVGLLLAPKTVPRRRFFAIGFSMPF